MTASGHENTLSLKKFCKSIGIELVELEDWNCCGSSSAHSIDHRIAQNLPFQNLSLAPGGRPLLIACPSCLIRIKQAYYHLKNDQRLQEQYERDWGVTFNPELDIIPFFELFNRINLSDIIEDSGNKLKGIKVCPYYGCMLSMPPDLRFEPGYHGVMEKTLSLLGAEVISFGYGTMCCGTYLSVAKPQTAEKVVNLIVSNAVKAGAECLVTACSMCHLNIEIRCTVDESIPILHFSELLSMALGVGDQKKWFPRHIVDPIPLLKKRDLLK